MEEKLNKRQQQAAQTEERIRKAGIRLFQERGYENTKISDICKEAGVSAGNFYHYFPSKDHLFLTRYAYFDVFVERVLSKRKYASNLEAIRDLLRAQVLCGNHSDPLLQVQVLQAQFNTHGAYVTEESRPIHQYAKRLLRQGIETGEIHSSHDVEHTVQLLFQVSRGILYDWALREDSFPLERQIDLALDLLLPSLARPMPPVTPPSDTEDFAAWQSEYFKEKGWLE